MARDLLLVGHRREGMTAFSAALQDGFATTVVAVAEQVLDRAAQGIGEGFQAVVAFVDDGADLFGLPELLDQSPLVVFLKFDAASASWVQWQQISQPRLASAASNITILAFSDPADAAIQPARSLIPALQSQLRIEAPVAARLGT